MPPTHTYGSLFRLDGPVDVRLHTTLVLQVHVPHVLLVSLTVGGPPADFSSLEEGLSSLSRGTSHPHREHPVRRGGQVRGTHRHAEATRTYCTGLTKFPGFSVECVT
eukprot:5943997-Prymnesium_polylepis.2